MPKIQSLTPHLSNYLSQMKYQRETSHFFKIISVTLQPRGYAPTKLRWLDRDDGGRSDAVPQRHSLAEAL